MILTSLVAPYVITWNDRIARLLVRPFGRAVAVAAPAPREARSAPEIVLLGHFRIAQAVLDLVEGQLPDMKGRITLVDYDANRAHAVMARGFRWEYGDLANPDALEHLGIEEARVVVTTISDTFLKGISTRRLVENLRRLAPRALIVMTGEEKSDAVDLLRAGADHVLIPGEITGERIVQLLTHGKPPAAS
jgi:voltage-gated potassium channel Kch